MDELINALLSKPSGTKVYFNDKGQWLFHPRPSFTIKKTKEEIVDEKPKAPKKGKSQDPV